MDLTKVTAVIVLYETTDDVFQCIKNLKDIKFIVIDNGKNDKSIVQKIKQSKNLIKYVESKKNLGFGRSSYRKDNFFAKILLIGFHKYTKNT